MMSESDEEIAARRIGTSVGTWTLERLLGIGGMASVFLGRRPDGYVAAIKILHPYLQDISELRKRFLREGPIGSALAAVGPLCEGLPAVYESGVSEDGAAFMAMELLDGETVFDRMARKGVLSVDEVLRIAHKVLDVLVVAHAFGIVHRDLKPENLHNGRDGRIRVLDFGIARVDTLPEGTAELPEKTATKTGVAIGSYEYMAPEQAMGKNQELDGRTDLFALGATMFRLLGGRYVHGDAENALLLVAAATRPAPPLASIAPHIPAPVCRVVDIALAFHKEARYPDAATMRFDVYSLRAGKTPPYATAVAEGRIRAGDRPPR
ncbi:MAG TPA: serine/threonine-protein kinase [Polyangium sp.]|uniref:Serine/threonine-protein kinase n=1 Tax=Polyangium mundeleinium TaxID=2995306 RepID=A0ABT5EZN5_9BACT|nr:serine/threonine-protein kinase [Polyangium mundeleinium]MDC0747302.1 serine/threonine-protein kinase [Polyangium mundeleinium]HVK71037.1 serine/threonine-protein kinase [Polyangium sp.]